MKRKIIRIDEEKCTGCGLCVPSCAEGALQIINGKAKVVSDKFCDGLGACLGKCPTGALTIEEREAEEFDEETAKAHVKMTRQNEFECPSAEVKTFLSNTQEKEQIQENTPRIKSKLSHWPIQLSLIPPNAPFIKDADLIIAADCVGFSYPNFHADFLEGRKLIIGCPKLDDAAFYQKKLEIMFKELQPKSIAVVNMEVPCCNGLYRIVQQALTSANLNVPLKQEIITIKGEQLDKK